MDHPDATVRKLLEAMALMEERLTAALAGRDGEQAARGCTAFSDELRPNLDPCCAYRDSIQHHRVEDPSAEEDLQPQAEVVESFESESAPPPPVVYDRYEEPNRDEIAEVLALLEYNEGASSATVLVNYTSTNKSPTKCSTMGFPNADRTCAVADVPAVNFALKGPVPLGATDLHGRDAGEAEAQEEHLPEAAGVTNLEPGAGDDGGAVVDPRAVVLHGHRADVREQRQPDGLDVGALVHGRFHGSKRIGVCGGIKLLCRFLTRVKAGEFDANK